MHHKTFRIISLTLAAILLLGLSIHPHKAYAQQNWEIDVNTTEDLKDPAYNTHCSAGQPTGGPCSLRAAIFEGSRYTAGSVTIRVPPGDYKLTRTEPDYPGEFEDQYGDLDFPSLPDGESTSIFLAGTGDADHPSVIDANFIDRVMQIGRGHTVYLINLVLKNGLTKYLDNDSDYDGGGLYVKEATVILIHVRLTNNEARGRTEEPFRAGLGGAINANNADISLWNCELDHNHADNSSALRAWTSNIRIYSSTFHHNLLDDNRDWHIGLNFGEARMINSTVADNIGGSHLIGILGGATSKPVTIQYSTIIAGSRSGAIYTNSDFDNLQLFYNILQVKPTPGIESEPVCGIPAAARPSLGGNVSSDDSCYPTVNDRVVPYAEMMLAPLGDYGGLTPTIALRKDSPATRVMMNNCDTLDGQSLDYDQREKERIDLWCDAGAFELQEDEEPSISYLPLVIKK